jgi:CRP/FNR family transcriptional regulator, cyclic AMP receptor protein
MQNREIWYIEDVDLFNAFCPIKLGGFTDSHSTISYDKGDFIYFANEPSETVYLIASGRVKISTYLEDGTEIINTYLGKGEIFGETAILGEQTRSQYAQADAFNTQICGMSRDTMMDLMLNDTEFQLRIYKLIGWRIQKLERRISMLLHKNVKQRFFEYMEELAKEYGSLEHDWLVIRHPLTQQNIADLIGTTRQTLNQLLRELQQEGVITIQRKKIIIKLPQKSIRMSAP